MSWTDFFIEREPAGPVAAPVAPVTIQSAPPTASITFSLAPAAPVSTEGILPKLRSKLPQSSIEKLEGAMATLDIADPMAKVKAAVGVLKAVAGVTLDQLQSDYAARIAALDGEVTRFNAAIASQTSAEVTSREVQIQQVNIDIDTKNREIQALSAKRDTLNQDIVAAKAKLGSAQAGFDSAITTVRGEVQDAVSRLKALG